MKKINGRYIVCVNGKIILRNATLSEVNYFLNGVTVSKRQSVSSAINSFVNRLMVSVAVVTIIVATVAFIA